MKRPRLWLALLIPAPFCFFYLKDSKRFVIWTLLGLFLPGILFFFFWLMPRPAWGKIHLAFLVCVFLAYYIIMVIETVRSHRQESKTTHWFFLRPAAYWAFPLYCIIYIAVGILADPLKSVFMSAHHILSQSSFPNLPIGDLLFIKNTISDSDLQRGRQITFQAPSSVGDKILIKRLIAVPGDTIEYELRQRTDCNCPNIEFRINGKKLAVVPAEAPPHIDKREHSDDVRFFSETNGGHTYFVATDTSAAHIPEDESNPPKKMILAADEYYVVGDFRPHSLDSRSFGVIKRAVIRGIYAYTYFSLMIPRELQTAMEMEPPIVWFLHPDIKFREHSLGRVSP